MSISGGVECRERSASDQRLRFAARVSAWVLLCFIAVSILSGWGITRTGIIYNASLGLIDRGLANSIHRAIQVPMAAVFLSHILINARLGLGSRLGQKTWPANTAIAISGILLLTLVIYMEFFA